MYLFISMQRGWFTLVYIRKKLIYKESFSHFRAHTHLFHHSTDFPHDFFSLTSSWKFYLILIIFFLHWIILACTRVFPLLSSSGFKSFVEKINIFLFCGRSCGNFVRFFVSSFQIESFVWFSSILHLNADLFIRCRNSYKIITRCKPLTIENFFQKK